MKKCEKCKFYFGDSQQPFENGVCASPKVLGGVGQKLGTVQIVVGRQICDREENGHFVYFEPLTPSAGAAFVQITREPMGRPMAMAATQ